MVPAFSTRAYTISGVPTTISQPTENPAQQQLHGISFSSAKWLTLRPENIENTQREHSLNSHLR